MVYLIPWTFFSALHLTDMVNQWDPCHALEALQTMAGAGRRGYRNVRNSLPEQLDDTWG